MKSFAWLETDSAELSRIWSDSVDLFERAEVTSDILLSGEIFDFTEYISAALCLTGDAKEVQTLIDEAIHNRAHVRLQQMLTIPLAIEEYLKYSNDTDTVCDWLDVLRDYWCHTYGFAMDHAVTATVYVGGAVVLQRLHSMCNMPFERVSLSKLITAYQSKYYDEKTMLYRDAEGIASSLIGCIVASYGFLADDARENIKRNLIEDGFCLPRAYRSCLLRAMANLEANDICFISLIEGGSLREEDSYAYLSGINVLIRSLMGVDMNMLGRGIQCMESCLTESIAYTLTMPYKNGFMVYEGGDT